MMIKTENTKNPIQGGENWVDKAVGGSAEAEDGEDQEGDGSSERQAWRPESQRCKSNILTWHNRHTHKDKYKDEDKKGDGSSECQAWRPESEGCKAY